MQRLMTQDLLWPACNGPDDLARIEECRSTDRGLPVSTYEVVRRAAMLWPDRPAMSFLPDAERWDQPSTRTFGEFAADVHRVAHVLSGLGIGRRDAVAIVSVNCEQLATALLAAEAVGIAAPINPALVAEHAQHLVELSAAQVVVAAGPELDPSSWDLARTLVTRTGATALLALRPVAAGHAPPPLEPIDGAMVGYLEDLAADARSDGLPVTPPVASDLASYLHTGGTTGPPQACCPDSCQRGQQRVDDRRELPARWRGRRFRRAPAVSHQRPARHDDGSAAARPARRVGGSARLPRRSALRGPLEARRALRDCVDVRRADHLRGAGTGARRC